ncbi:MAG: metal ABC transporter substrate-binding protein [Lautropia sp.]
MRIRTSACLGLASGLIALVLPAAPALALDVFACEPEWAALVRVLAPDARVTTATHARQDPHHIEARPALIAGLRRADLAVCTGASLEIGWLPMLQQRSGNALVQDGAPGMFYAAQAVELIEAHAQVDRSMGDVHAEGNPHFHLDPRRLARVAASLTERLGRIDAPGRAGYAQRLAAWQAQWEERIARWEAKAMRLKGRRVVAQHSGFDYLWAWLGLEQIADLEPKPGLPPTAAHLQTVLQQVRDAPPMVIVQTLYQDPQPGRWLHERIATPLLRLPSTVTPDGSSTDLESLFDHLIAELDAVAAKAPR